MADSPCVRNCCLDQQDICLGCGRHVDEIIEWHNASLSRQAEILQLAQSRMTSRVDSLLAMHRAANPSE
uniref:DUF1289 domain-containing protein n=1 Tax=Rheinheimera sp. BAL341 TaxID=1708203 RepID=A0A486XJ74_9GAMM